MMTVGEMLRTKGYGIWSVAPNTTVFEALEQMAEKNVGAVMVMDGDCLVGILSERDYAREAVRKGRAPTEIRVDEIMTQRVVYVRPEQTSEDCMALMTDKRVRHLPVMEGEKTVGVISIGDVVKAIMGEQEFIIEQLEHYITGIPHRPT